jgi:hypothetical protein
MKVKIILYLSLICCLTNTAIGASSLFDLQKIAKDNVKLTLQVAQLPKQRKSSLLTAVQLKINRLMPEYWQALIENAETSKQQNQTRKLLRTQRVERVTRKLTGLYIIYQALALNIKAHNTPAILSPVDACFLRALIRSEENRQVYGSLPETACTSSPAEIDQPKKPSTASTDITKSPKLPLYSGIAFWEITVKSKNSTRPKDQLFDQNHNNETFSIPPVDFLAGQTQGSW